MKLPNLAAAAALALTAACTSHPQPAGYEALRLCETASSVLDRLTVQREAGLLSNTDIRRVDYFIEVLDPICSGDTPPTGADTTTIQMALDQLELILARRAQ